MEKAEVTTNIDYDARKIFRRLSERGIKSVIKVRRRAVITGNRARDMVVRAVRKGKKKWRKANGYGRR